VRLSREGLGLRFVTDAGETLPPAVAFESALLDTLSTVRTSTDRSSARGMAALKTALGSGREGDGLIVGVFGHLDPAEARAVAGLRRGTASCVAVLIDLDIDLDIGLGDAPRTGPGTAAQILRAEGWRVLTIASAAALATAWAQADQAGEDASSWSQWHHRTAEVEQ
jgi:hypothetical protein